MIEPSPNTLFKTVCQFDTYAQKIKYMPITDAQPRFTTKTGASFLMRLSSNNHDNKKAPLVAKIYQTDFCVVANPRPNKIPVKKYRFSNSNKIEKKQNQYPNKSTRICVEKDNTIWAVTIIAKLLNIARRGKNRVNQKQETNKIRVLISVIMSLVKIKVCMMLFVGKMDGNNK